jgi:hypothetical protein
MEPTARVEVDDEVSFRLPSDREPRCNLRGQQGDPNAVAAVDQSEEDSLDSASVTNAGERSFLPRSGAKSAPARAEYPHNVEQEISRINEHIACLKSQYRNLKYSNALRRKGAMASDDVTADGMLNMPYSRVHGSRWLYLLVLSDAFWFFRTDVFTGAAGDLLVLSDSRVHGSRWLCLLVLSNKRALWDICVRKSRCVRRMNKQFSRMLNLGSL